MLTFRFDYAAKGRGLGATPIAETPEGYKVYKGVAAFGDVVLEYPEDGVNELAPTAEVMGSGIAESLIGVPFTILHPDDLLDASDPDTLREHVEGTVRAARANLKANPPELEVEVVVWTRPAQDDIESGRVVELSPGYNRDPEQAPRGATFGGKPYQIVQRKRRYNHLSGVISARGVTPDGRRARLDEASSEPPARAAYAPLSMDDLITDPAPTDDTKRADAEPAPEAEAEAGGEVEGEDIEIAAEEMPLEGFSPEDAEVLKMLSPEGLARLMMALQQVKAEAAEQAVMAAPPGASVEVEAAEVDASAAAREKEAIGEVEQVAAKKAEAEVGKDATAPMAPQGLSAQDVAAMVKQAVSDLYDQMKADMAKAKADASRLSGTSTDVSRLTPANAAKVDATAIAATLAERRRLDAAFVAHAKRDGHLGEADPATVKTAATKMLAVITEHLPALVPMARDALKDPKRRDSDFVSIYAAAEKARRDALIDDQQQAFVGFDGSGGYDPAATAIIDDLFNARAG